MMSKQKILTLTILGIVIFALLVLTMPADAGEAKEEKIRQQLVYAGIMLCYNIYAPDLDARLATIEENKDMLTKEQNQKFFEMKLQRIQIICECYEMDKEARKAAKEGK